MPFSSSFSSNSSISYSSSSSSSNSTSTGRNGQMTSHSYSSQQHSGPHGTTVRTTTQNNNEPPVEETHHFDASGREVPSDRIHEGRTLGSASSSASTARGRIEDMSEETETGQM